jgi:hypothetical protein
MKRSTAGRVVPALAMAAASAVPIGTTIEILTHVRPGGAGMVFASRRIASSALPARATRSVSAPTTTPAKTMPVATPHAPATVVPAPVTQTYPGTVVYDDFGAVQATITVTNKKIVDVTAVTPTDGVSTDINSQAVPILRSETLTSPRSVPPGIGRARPDCHHSRRVRTGG